MEIPKIIEKNKDAVVLIDVRVPEGNNRYRVSIKGSGFMISEGGEFITCAHVYDEIPESEREFLGVAVPGGVSDKGLLRYDRYQIELVNKDIDNDLARMKIVNLPKGRKFEVVEEIDSRGSIQEGDELAFIGYPLATDLLRLGFGITLTTNKCIVSSIKKRGVDGSLHFFLIDTHTNNGSSGSPVFSLETGRVVGVVSGKISTKVPTSEKSVIDVPANIGLCRPSIYINKLN